MTLILRLQVLHELETMLMLTTIESTQIIAVN